jgi:DNA-binding CsgD family transcriptional regulator
VLVWPAPRGESEGWVPGALGCLGQPLHTLVLIKKMVPHEQLSPQVFMQLYGLSPAEARLAQSLCQGQSVEEHAERFQVSVNTVRTQVRAILGKTGCARQQDLVRMLAALPTV